MHFGLLFDAVQEILLARQHKKQINNDQYQFSRFRVQCDEIAILFFQYLAINNNENFPNALKNFTNSQIIIQKMAKNF